jgi:hypothetical protein
MQVVVPGFNGPIYKGILPDIASLLPALNFPNMINRTQTVRLSQPVVHSFSIPFPTVHFKQYT